MNISGGGVKSAPITGLRNVTLFMQLVERLTHRPGGLPGFGCFYGYSGFGKTRAAVFSGSVGS